MQKSTLTLVAAAGLGMLVSLADAQSARAAAPAKDYSNSRLVTRMMSFDKKGDGKLTREEIIDERLVRLFDEADANHDGVVTRDELIALAAKLDSEIPPGGDRFGPGPGGPGRFPAPGQILPPGMDRALNLTPEQQEQLKALQDDTTAKLAKILTPEQMKQLESGPPRGRF